MRWFWMIGCTLGALFLGTRAYQAFFYELRDVVTVESLVVVLPGQSLERRVIFPSDRRYSGGSPYVFHGELPLGLMTQTALCTPPDRPQPHADSYHFSCAWEEDGQWHRAIGVVLLPAHADVRKWHFETERSVLVPTHKSWHAVNEPTLLRGLFALCGAGFLTIIVWGLWTLRSRGDALPD